MVECTSEYHERLKADDAWWEAQEPAGVQMLRGQPVMVLKNCRLCQSTLARWCVCLEQVEEMLDA